MSYRSSLGRVRRPFISPLQRPQQPLAFHSPPQLNPSTLSHSGHQSPTRQSSDCGPKVVQEVTSPISITRPPPLPQHHPHSMMSPPHIPPTPPDLVQPFAPFPESHPELDEIMDFERRKKAVNMQRKDRGLLSRTFSPPGQSAQIQRDATAVGRISEGDASPHLARLSSASSLCPSMVLNTYVMRCSQSGEGLVTRSHAQSRSTLMICFRKTVRTKTVTRLLKQH